MDEKSGLFLSHSHMDKPFVRRLALDLTARGIRVWLDEAEMLLGDSLVAKIGEAICDMDFVGAVLSNHSVKSPWVTRELDIAINQEIEGKRVKVLPLVIDDCQLPPFLLGKVYADFRDNAGYDQALQQVLRRLTAPMLTGLSGPSATPQKFAPGDFLGCLVSVRQAASSLKDAIQAAKFLDLLASLGSYIETHATEVLTYQTLKPYVAAYNAVVELKGEPPNAIAVLNRTSTLITCVDHLILEAGVQGLRADYPGDRAKAARALGGMGSKASSAVGTLRHALKDTSHIVRSAAAWALAAIGDEEALAAVKAYESK